MNGFNLVYLNARVCVHDIGILDEESGEFEIIDGIFGDNFICASMNMATWDISSTPYDNVVMDTVRGVLGFDVKADYPVPVRRFTDIDADCDVDIDDLAVMSFNWLRTDCGSENDYCDYADIDKDGEVNFEDYVFAASDWLKGGCQYACGSERRPRPGADFSGDCEVDIFDLQIAAEEWLKECDWLNYNCRGADMARDGVVNFEDFGEFANQMRVRP
ncbi:MAG: hypothetical protein BWY69_00842 [Planctomycetes bacterium ADurb.Bin401]|nr:MAG: hypothetical protein BWY69_00842 [Planctomycetes bacterium ADurb.Bin401]